MNSRLDRKQIDLQSAIKIRRLLFDYFLFKRY